MSKSFEKPARQTWLEKVQRLIGRAPVAASTDFVHLSSGVLERVTPADVELAHAYYSDAGIPVSFEEERDT